jgi:ribosome-binding factor A
MMKQNSFTRRLNENAHEALASVLLYDVSDPRLAFVTLTGVEVSPDRRVARVFVSALPEEREQAMLGLQSARGRIRSLLARRLAWKITPELHFELDNSLDEAERITRALHARPATLDIPKDEEGYPLDTD